MAGKTRQRQRKRVTNAMERKKTQLIRKAKTPTQREKILKEIEEEKSRRMAVVECGLGDLIQPWRGEFIAAKHPDKITEEEISAALVRSMGILAVAARMLGVSRAWVEERAEKTPALQALVRDIYEARLDFAEAKMMEHMINSNWDATKFYLERKGRKRGYNVENTPINNGGKLGHMLDALADEADK